MAKKDTVHGLKKKLKEVDDCRMQLIAGREMIAEILDIYRRSDHYDIANALNKLIEQGKAKRISLENKVRDLEQSESTRNEMLKKENKKLWFLIRSITGDKTLEKEYYNCEVDPFGNPIKNTTPFSE